VIDDVLGLIVLSVVIALAPLMAHTGLASWSGLSITLGRMVVCLAVIGLLGPIFANWAMKYAARLHGNHTEVAVALAVALFLAFLAQWGGGMAAITGSYLAGLFIAMTPEREKVVVDLHPLLNSFFWTAILCFDWHGSQRQEFGRARGFLCPDPNHCDLGKIVGSGLGAYWTGFTRRESIAVGVGMIPRGEVGLITASLGLAAGLVTRQGLYFRL